MLRSFAFCLVNWFITSRTVNVFVVVCNGNWEMSSEACVTRNLNSMDYTYRYFSMCCSDWKHNWKLSNCTSLTVLPLVCIFLYISLKCAFCFLMNPCRCLHIYNNFATCHERCTIYSIWRFTKSYETFCCGKVKQLSGYSSISFRMGSFELYVVIPIILPHFNISVVGLSWNGLQLLCHIQLCLRDVLISSALQGNL